jgi:hypothetical protein
MALCTIPDGDIHVLTKAVVDDSRRCHAFNNSRLPAILTALKISLVMQITHFSDIVDAALRFEVSRR